MVKGVSKEIQDKAMAIVKAGVKAKRDGDDIRGEIFQLGINFGKVNKLYKAVMKTLGYVVDVPAIKKEIDERIKKTSFTYDESWDQLKSFSDAVCDDVAGATEPRVFSQLRLAFKVAGKDFPKKTATPKARMGAVNKTLVDVFAANKGATKAEVEAALTDVSKNAANYTKSLYALCFALSNGMTSEDALKALSE